MRTRHALTTTALSLAAGLLAQAPVLAPNAQVHLGPVLEVARKADLLAAGKTQGTWHLTGLVRKDRTVVLRWGNDAGEMPTEGVRVFRQKAGDSAWKDLTGKNPVGFLRGKSAEKALSAMKKEEREDLLAYPFGDIQHDPVTRLRLPEDPKVQATRRAQDFTPEKSLQQFRSLRSAGRLSRQDLELLHVKADVSGPLSEALGLAYTDDPGKGQFRYKIVVALPEGGAVEVVCPKTFTTTEPTPIPQPVSLSAASGNGEVLLNWDETPSDVLGGYHVYRADTPDGPWKRLNEDAVKRVELDVEDPELSLRRSLGVRSGVDRMLRPLPVAARTPQKVQEAHRQALEQVERPGGLPELTPAQSKSVKEAVAAGRLRPGGPQAPRALFTDSRRTPGNALQNERTYYYKVTAVDLGGLQQPLETAPVVPGIPKDLEPPQVPGRPMLKAEAAARTDLRASQAARLKDPRLAALAPAASASAKVAPSAALALQPGKGTPAPAPTPATLSGAEVQRMKLSRTAATMPVAALQKLGESSVLRSNADGSVPPAQLTWTLSSDADIQGYQVHRATGSGPFAKVADTTAPEWTDTTLAAGQLYRYAVSAVDKLGNVSALSPVGRVEVSDSRLPGRLAIPQLTGLVAKEAPALIPVRRLLRPQGRAFASGSLASARVTAKAATGSEPVVAEFVAPKTTLAPKVALTPMAPKVASASKAPLAKELALVPAAEVSPAKLSASVKPVTKVFARTLNPMLAPLAAPKEIHVVLEWAKPLQDMPLTYVIQQAPQRMEVVTALRPTVAMQAGLTAFRGLTATGSPKPLAVTSAPSAPTPGAKPSPTAGLVVTTPALHAQVAKGLVATGGQGLRLADLRKDHLATLVPKGGPGLFTRVNEAPVTTERYVVTFPAEAAQYGGASFYFRVQAFTQEFGRTVEGPLSAPVEVRLPDIVSPPSPAVGAVDLQEGAAGRLDVALTWTQAAAKDLVGVVVDRQPMTFTVVEGEAKPGAPAGPAERITPSPVGGLAFKDKGAPVGYQRYTLRAVDATGNLSDPLGSLDILVPGEPTPGAPTALTVAGSQLAWKAAPEAAGYTVWRSFTGQEDDWSCISAILPATTTTFTLPAEGTLHLRVVARSASGMNATPSAPIVRTP